MSTARILDNITLADIREVLGQNGKKSNGNWLFQCPLCQDSSADNLIVKGNGAYIHCFSCANNEGGKYVLTEIEKKRAEERKNEVKDEQPCFLDKELQKRYVEFMETTNQELINSTELLNLLYEKRGIDRQTVEDCGLGFDSKNDEWVIPIFSLKYEGFLMGFEYRRKNFDKYDNSSKVRRTKGYITDNCPVWGRSKAKTLIISEGFWDAYALHQFLRSRGNDDHTIYSCSNGVTSLLNVINQIKFFNFNEVKLILDTDDAGSKVTDEIVGRYPFIMDKRGFLFKSECKDVNEWYMKEVLGAK